MTKFISVRDIKWNFYESMGAGDKDSMADYFESLYHHYQKRGKIIKKLSQSNQKVVNPRIDYEVLYRDAIGYIAKIGQYDDFLLWVGDKHNFKIHKGNK